MKSEQPDYWNVKLHIIIMHIHHFCLLTYLEWDKSERESLGASDVCWVAEESEKDHILKNLYQ